MGLSKFFLNTGEALRPVLTKIIPMKLLSKMKAGIINNATDKLSADSIEKYEVILREIMDLDKAQELCAGCLMRIKNLML